MNARPVHERDRRLILSPGNVEDLCQHITSEIANDVAGGNFRWIKQMIPTRSEMAVEEIVGNPVLKLTVRRLAPFPQEAKLTSLLPPTTEAGRGVR
jgi:hypothetical protein